VPLGRRGVIGHFLALVYFAAGLATKTMGVGLILIYLTPGSDVRFILGAITSYSGR